MPDGNVASLEKDLSPHEIHFCRHAPVVGLCFCGVDVCR